MKNNNSNNNKPYRIYDKKTGIWFEVTPEQYKEFNNWRTALRMREYYHRRCMCTRKKLWLCDGMCQDCEFHAPGNIHSLDMMFEKANEEIKQEPSLIFKGSIEFETNVCTSLALKELVKKLEREMPGAKEIILLRLQGYSDTYIAKVLGIARTTMLSRWKKALSKLNVSLSDYL